MHTITYLVIIVTKQHTFYFSESNYRSVACFKPSLTMPVLPTVTYLSGSERNHQEWDEASRHRCASDAVLCSVSEWLRARSDAVDQPRQRHEHISTPLSAAGPGRLGPGKLITGRRGRTNQVGPCNWRVNQRCLT